MRSSLTRLRTLHLLGTNDHLSPWVIRRLQVEDWIFQGDLHPENHDVYYNDRPDAIIEELRPAPES